MHCARSPASFTKGPWSLQEDYILALAQCRFGNLKSKWNKIGPYLPHRSQNALQKL